MKKNKHNYVAPGLTVVEFRVEKGYAYSITSPVQQINTEIEHMMFMAQPAGDNNNSLVGGYMDGAAIDNSNPTGGSGWEYENGGWF